MKQWFILLQKELLEMLRNFKWIWVPLTFILLGAMDPLSSYYLPKIIDTLGGLPEGAMIDIPTPSPQEVLISTIADYDMLGILIVVLITMGVVAGERKSGVAGIILVKPVSFTSYITAKWAGVCILVWVSCFVGFLASWYYIGILFDWIPFQDFMQSFLVYGMWLTFVLTVTVFFSSIFKTTGIVGFTSIAVVVILNLVSGALSHLFEWSPAQLTPYVNQFLLTQSFPDETLLALLVAGAGIMVLLFFSILIFRKKELAA
jgi:ABC-2 type transport system permease protein